GRWRMPFCRRLRKVTRPSSSQRSPRSLSASSVLGSWSSCSDPGYLTPPGRGESTTAGLGEHSGWQHPGVGVERRQLAGCADVADYEGAFVNPPEPLALGKLGELAGFSRGQPQYFAGGDGFIGGLVVEDAGGGVAEQSLGEAA